MFCFIPYFAFVMIVKLSISVPNATAVIYWIENINNLQSLSHIVRLAN